MSLKRSSTTGVAPPPALTDGYFQRLARVLERADRRPVERLARSLHEAWLEERQIFLCGNGGSAANAIHIATDFVYEAGKKTGTGLKAYALTADSAVVTCIGNDVSYDSVFARQIAVRARAGDLLLALSGSGNSRNVVEAIRQAKRMGLETFAILGFTGGQCVSLVDVPIHFRVDDMQISEDLQLIVGHMVTQWLRDQALCVRPQTKSGRRTPPGPPDAPKIRARKPT